SFGAAVLVKHKENQKIYILKEVNISHLGKKEKDECINEVDNLQNLQHPNIVSNRESFVENEQIYIIMNYTDGEDLFQRIQKQKGQFIPEDEILNYFVQICLAIKHIHDRKILHRDIKLQNIFLTSKNIVKLGNFGISHIQNSTIEMSKTSIGNPYYLSPEICKENKYSFKSDIWALGCVLYDLVALKRAFEAKILKGEYAPITGGEYSSALINLISRMLRLNPKQRPTIDEILHSPIIQNKINSFLSDFNELQMKELKQKEKLQPEKEQQMKEKSKEEMKKKKEKRKNQEKKKLLIEKSLSRKNKKS
ncbi:MAG: putative serine/threonine-protein kinase Nek1, partial [Streblomastix strix]